MLDCVYILEGQDQEKNNAFNLIETRIEKRTLLINPLPVTYLMLKRKIVLKTTSFSHFLTVESDVDVE